jgi:Fe-S oxidoreductase/FAD/FMN-containing dehydrogenase
MAAVGLNKDLQEIVGETRVTTSRFERRVYAADFVPIPEIVRAFFKTLPDAVVKPVNAVEVGRVLSYCSAKSIPVTPRGGGSSGLFGAVPKKGGIALDLRGLSGVIDIDREGQRVTAEAGVTWWELDRVVKRAGLTLKSYPSSALSATLGGWIMGSGLGIGSLLHGEVSDHLITGEVALPDGSVKAFGRGHGLQWFCQSEGMLGVLTQVTLSLRRVKEASSHHLIYFADVRDLFDFARDLGRRSPTAYAVELFDSVYMSLVKSSGYPVTDFLPGGGAALVTYEGSPQEMAEADAAISELVLTHKGEMRPGAEEEWGHRFNMMRIRRAAPTVLPSSVHVPVDQLWVFYSGTRKLNKRPIGFLGHLVSPTDCLVMPMLITDQRSPMEFLFALHTPRDLAELALSVGGRPGGGVGVWNAPYRKKILSDHKMQEMKEKKRGFDPKGVLNPGMWLDPLLLFTPSVYQPVMATAGLLDRILPAAIGEENKKDVRYEFSACVQCGYCAQYCPTRGEWFSATPRGRILTTREVLTEAGIDESKTSPEYVNAVFQCSLCGRCKVDCSVSIDSPTMWVDLRGRLAEKGLEPDALKGLAKTVLEHHNLTGKANDQRAGWAKRIKVRSDLNKKAGVDVVYFVGCVTSFYPMVQDVARSFAQFLDLAGVDFTLLGGEEWCCGYPLISAGHKNEALESLLHNGRIIKTMGTKTVAVTCPGCYRMWKHEYESATGEPPPFEVLHSTELILRLIKDGRVSLGELNETVTYHDPCDLGRVAGIYDPPRDIIKSIPGVGLTELEDNRERCNCCGSGGDLLASNTDMSLAIGARKLEEALLTGAKNIVTACPSCERALLMAKTARKFQIEVLDVAQFVWKAALKG